MLKIRRPLGRLIFNMGIAIPGKTVFLIETAPWWLLMGPLSCYLIWSQVLWFLMIFFLTNNLTQILPESYITEILLSRWNNFFYCNYGSYIDGLVQDWYLHCNVLEMLKCCTSHQFTFTFCWFFCIFYIFFLYFFSHRQTVDLNFDLNSDDDSSPFGPLTQRLVSALIEENIMTPLDDGSIETGK